MDNIIDLVFLPLGVAAIVSYFVTPIVIASAKKLGIVDDPKKHIHPKVIHTYPVPRGGGIPVFLGILTASIFLITLDQHLVGILLGAFVIVILGVIDDRLDLNPHKRLAIQFL